MYIVDGNRGMNREEEERKRKGKKKKKFRNFDRILMKEETKQLDAGVESIR